LPKKIYLKTYRLNKSILEYEQTLRQEIGSKLDKTLTFSELARAVFSTCMIDKKKHAQMVNSIVEFFKKK